MEIHVDDCCLGCEQYSWAQCFRVVRGLHLVVPGKIFPLQQCVGVFSSSKCYALVVIVK